MCFALSPILLNFPKIAFPDEESGNLKSRRNDWFRFQVVYDIYLQCDGQLIKLPFPARYTNGGAIIIINNNDKSTVVGFSEFLFLFLFYSYFDSVLHSTTSHPWNYFVFHSTIDLPSNPLCTSKSRSDCILSCPVSRRAIIYMHRGGPLCLHYKLHRMLGQVLFIVSAAPDGSPGSSKEISTRIYRYFVETALACIS